MNARQPSADATAEALRASELRYRRLFESAKDGILILDAATGKIVDVNPFLIELLGFSREAFLGKKVWKLGFFKDIAANEAKFAELQAKGYVQYADLPLEAADGRQVAVEFVSNVYLVNQHKVIQCNIRDITARKRTEDDLRELNANLDRRVCERTAELRKANRAYRVLGEGNRALWRAGDEAELLRTICQLMVEQGGYRLAWVGFAEEDEARSVRPVAQAGFEEGYLDTLHISWADTERGRGPTGTAIRTGQPVVVQDILQDPKMTPWRKEALQRGYAASVALPLAEQGRPFGALMVYATETNAFDGQELTLLAELAGNLAFGIVTLRLHAERKRAEAALRESEGRFRILFEQTADIILLLEITPEGIPVIWDANSATFKLLGYERDELIGQPVSFIEAEPNASKVVEKRRRNILSGKGKKFDARHRCKDGRIRDFECSVNEMQIASKTFAISVERDIADRKRAEERMQAFSQEIITAREQERKQVSSILHHDVGSLAVGLSAHLDAIEEDLRTGKPREALKWVKRTRKLFHQTVVRLKEVAIRLRPPELDVLGLCAALRQHFSQVTKHQGIRIHLRENLGRKRVSGDTATILFRVAQEALTNALTHGHAKQVDVGIRASKKKVRLTVRDNGRGFDLSEQRARATAQMGLRVMRELAAAAGGAFTIDSERGQGTTVRVSLPLEERRKAEGGRRL